MLDRKSKEIIKLKKAVEELNNNSIIEISWDS
jgi:TusA-related sulfurtransferase